MLLKTDKSYKLIYKLKNMRVYTKEKFIMFVKEFNLKEFIVYIRKKI